MRVAIIGGTGVDELAELRSGRARTVATRFGDTFVVETEVEGEALVFVPRHGLEHSVLPHLINYRAQIAALKKLEVDCVIGVCAVGSLRAYMPEGSFAVLGDFIDLTKCRANTFFDEPGSPLIHTDFSEPYCPEVSAAIVKSCQTHGIPCRPDAVYIGVEGPRYESPAEIGLYVSWGGDVIGMTNLPEAVLAREAGLCYGAMAIVTNLAAGLSPSPLAHDEVRAAMAAAAEHLRSVIREVIKTMPQDRHCDCPTNTGLVV